jgi:hypothetical protein
MPVFEFSTGKSYTRSKKLYSTALVRSHRHCGLAADRLDVVRKLRGTFSARPNVTVRRTAVADVATHEAFKIAAGKVLGYFRLHDTVGKQEGPDRRAPR